mgnify:CR=1 FL=1
MRAGAVGYMLKDAPADRLIQTIRRVHAGQVFIQPEIASRLLRELITPHDSPIEPLSEREREVLVLLAQGHSNREIAEQLVLAEGTVKNHVSNILSKMGVRDRTRAVLKASAGAFPGTVLTIGPGHLDIETDRPVTAAGVEPGELAAEGDATVAEWRLGVATACDDVVLVTLGTGIGGGYVMEGKIVRGVSYTAGEAGHMIIKMNGPRRLLAVV